jgi:hypothetical protein
VRIIRDFDRACPHPRSAARRIFYSTYTQPPLAYRVKLAIKSVSYGGSRCITDEIPLEGSNRSRREFHIQFSLHDPAMNGAYRETSAPARRAREREREREREGGFLSPYESTNASVSRRIPQRNLRGVTSSGVLATNLFRIVPPAAGKMLEIRSCPRACLPREEQDIQPERMTTKWFDRFLAQFPRAGISRG